PRAPLEAVSARASALGIRRGHSAAQARAISGAVIVRQTSPELRRSAEDAILDVADSFSPLVENAGGGIAFLEIDGLVSLFGTESHLATSLGARLRRVGLDARVAVASSKTAAWLAAERSAGVEVIPPGQERRKLSSLPLAPLLEGSPPELAVTLERWGIRTLGDLARLPVGALGWRFGEIGIRLWRRARAEDEEPLVPHVRPLSFEESVDCEYAIETFEPLSFLLRAALERLTARLDVRGFKTGELSLSLRLADGGCEARTLPLAAPTNEVKVLLALLRVHVESHPPRGPVESFALSAAAVWPRSIELDLFAPAGPMPDELDLTVARLAALAGAERVGSPRPIDGHRPEAFVLERLSPGKSVARAAVANGHRPLALRAFRPPAVLEVMCDRDRPDFVRSSSAPVTARFSGRVVQLAGPWRLSGEWWRESSYARDYYDAELSDGCVYRIYREQRSGEWYADGVYD
ncbi:MAG: DNA polymerase Y family protein, partial [Candidatus Binatia bacterium]